MIINYLPLDNIELFLDHTCHRKQRVHYAFDGKLRPDCSNDRDSKAWPRKWKITYKALFLVMYLCDRFEENNARGLSFVVESKVTLTRVKGRA